MVSRLEPAQVGRQTRANLARRAPWLVLAIGLLGEAIVLVIQDRRLWFYRDDFAFLLDRQITRHPVDALMSAHSVHWSTLPVIAFRVMWSIFGLRHYLPYALMPLVLHLALAAALVVLVRRAGAGAWPAVLTGLVFAYLGGGAGAENPLWAFQIGFIGSCLGGVAALICFQTMHDADAGRSARRWFWAGQAFLVAALMCSGMGVPMVVAAGAWALLRRGWASALRTVVVPALAFAGWYLGWGRVAFATQAPGPGLGHALVSAAVAVEQIWRAAIAVPGAGIVVLVALVAAVIGTRRLGALQALGAAGLIGLAFEFLVIGLGRAGLADRLHSRYVYVGLAFCAPAVACAFTLIAERIRRRQVVGAVAWLVTAVVVVVGGSVETVHFADYRHSLDPARRQQLLAAGVLIRHGAPLLSNRIDPIDPSPAPAMSVSTLLAAHALGELPAGRPGRVAVFDERSMLQVNVAPTAMHVPSARSYRWFGHRVTHGCTTRTTTSYSRVAVRLGAHGAQVAITLRSPAAHAVHTQIAQAGQLSRRTTWPLTADWHLTGPHLYVASTMHHAVLRVILPAGQITVCDGA